MPGRGRYPRTARVNHVLQEVVAEALERMATDDERLQLVTVTGVEADADLRHAKVFYAARHPDAGDALESQRVALQRTINRETRLRRTPQLVFLPDPAIASGWRVEEILKDLSERDDTSSNSDSDSSTRDETDTETDGDDTR